MSDPNSFYSILALYYDDIHQEALLRSVRYLSDFLSRECSGNSGKKALDLGCGTGYVANYLYEKDWEVHGIDFSSDMINILKSKYPFLSCSVSDIRCFHAESVYDLVVCFGDTLNHLLGEKDWLSVFRSVHSSLKKGGLFCFDVITPYDHKEIWPYSISLDERDGFTHIARGSITKDGEPVLVNTWFVKEDLRWKRYDFHLFHRSYPLEAILQWLSRAGLVDVVVLDGESLEQLTDATTRWVIYASK